MFICENISCVREKHILFKDVGICLQPGAFLLIKGDNGSGKTSLIDILAGKSAPDTGRILWNGEDIRHRPYLQNEMMHIGHNSDIDEKSTVLKNVTRWARQYDTETLINAALHYYDLTEYKDHKAANLSEGLKRRLALTRLILAPCKLWLLDEPTNFLDEKALHLTTSLIETRVTQGGIVIVATHIMRSSVAAHTLELADFKPSNPTL